MQFGDYALWQAQRLAEPEMREQLDTWIEHLRGAPAVIDLPTDRPRPAIQTYNGAWHELRLGTELTGSIKALANSHNTTLFMVLLAIFDLLLQKYSGQTDIVVGTPIAGRQRSELDNLIGMFINTLCLRTDLDGNPQFDELLRRVKQVSLHAYANQETPFEKLVEELQPERDVSHPPIFQVLFVLQESLAEHIEFEGLEVTPLDFELGSAKFDLSMFLVELPDGLTVSIEYNTDLFAPETV